MFFNKQFTHLELVPTYFKCLLPMVIMGLMLHSVSAQVTPRDSLLKESLKREVKIAPVGTNTDSTVTSIPSKPDTNVIGATLNGKKDTTGRPKKKTGDIKTTVKYSCTDSMRFDANKKVFFLYRDSKIDYGDISLKADRIDVNWITNQVTSQGTPDSAGKVQGVPVFAQGNDKYVAQRIKYNFKTKKGIISEVVTQQGEGYLHGDRVKKNPDNNMFVSKAQYTTCNLAHPHFYINAPKLKMVPGDRLICGPFNMVFADVPTPLGFAFGVFPTPKTRSAGIVVPTYGEATDRGFFLRNGGYYFPIGDYAGVKLLGELYSKGSYGFNVLSNYKFRYHYNGNLELRYNKRKTGEEGFETIAEDYWISWSHQPESFGSSKFQASVNMGSSSYNRRNSWQPQNYLQQNFNSSVSYYKTFTGTPFTLSLAARQTQNVQTGLATATLPDLTFAMNRIYPFKTTTGNNKTWYRQISFSYNFQASNQLSNGPQGQAVVPGGGISYDKYDAASDTVLKFNAANFKKILNRAQFGAKHSIPISTTVTAFRYFNLSPTLSYNETWYLNKYKYTYVPDAYAVNVDTINQFSRFYSFSASVGATTRLYGTYFVRRAGLEAIRHTLIPSIAYSFTPDFSDPRFGFYQDVVIDKPIGKPATVVKANPFPTFLGGPARGKSANLSFNFQNQIEAKIRAKADTSRKDDDQAKKKKFEKRTILDNLGLSGSYNLAADSFKLSNLNLVGRTKLFNRFDVNVNGTFDPYEYVHNYPAPTREIPNPVPVANDPGRRINRYVWEDGAFSLGRLTSFGVNFGTSFNPKARKPKAKKDYSQIAESELAFINANPNLYLDWNIPWNLSTQYNLSYSKQGFSKGIRAQVLTLNGDVSVTQNWKIAASTSYDVEAHGFGFTNLNIYRNLHCWEMRFNWIPFGQRQSYTLDINVKASILQDLKLSKRSTWYDR